MLAHRIIPSLLCSGRQLVKGERFDSSRSVGVAAQAVRIHQSRGVDELVLLDVAATREHRGPDLKLIAELSEVCFMPLSVGGGITDVGQVVELLRAGADKVVIGTGLWDNLYLGIAIQETFGRQVLVGAIDVQGDRVCVAGGTRKCKAKPSYYARVLEMVGVGEILLTSIDREGTMTGYDLDLIREVSEAVDIPVIAHGGCGSYEDMLLALQAGAHSVSAGALFQFTEATPQAAAAYLKKHGMEVRDLAPG